MLSTSQMNVLKSPHFEDFSAGQVITTMRRTIAEADMLSFVQLTGLFEELWLDAGKAEATGLYTGRLVPGYLTLTFAEGLFVLAGCWASPTSSGRDRSPAATRSAPRSRSSRRGSRANPCAVSSSWSTVS